MNSINACHPRLLDTSIFLLCEVSFIDELPPKILSVASIGRPCYARHAGGAAEVAKGRAQEQWRPANLGQVRLND